MDPAHSGPASFLDDENGTTQADVRRSRPNSRVYTASIPSYGGLQSVTTGLASEMDLVVGDFGPGLRGLYERARRTRSALIFLVSLILFTDMLVYGVVVPVLPVIVRERLNGDAKQTGILFGSIAIGILIATPIFGILSDYYRTRKRPMISALLISASATLCFAYARNFWQLLLARILQGAAGGASWTISLSMIADAFPAHNLGIAMSSTLVWNSFGFLAGPAIGGFLFEYGGYAMPFFFCTGCAIFAIICTAIVKPPVLYFEELTPDEILGADAPDEATEHTALLRNSDVLVGGQSSMPDPIEESLAQGYWETESDYALSGISGISQSPTQLNMLRLVREQPIILNCLTILTAASVFSGIEPTLPIHLADRFHMEPSVIGMMFMAILLPHMLAGPIVGWMCDRIAPKTVASVGLVVFALATPPIAVPDKVQTEVIVLMLFGTMAAVAMTPVLPDMTNYVARMGGGAYAQAIALWNMAYSIGMFIGPVLGGFLMEHYSFFYSMVAFAVALLAIAPLLASADETITSSQAAQRRMSYGTIDTLEDHEDIAAV